MAAIIVADDPKAFAVFGLAKRVAAADGKGLWLFGRIVTAGLMHEW